MPRVCRPVTGRSLDPAAEVRRASVRDGRAHGRPLPAGTDRRVYAITHAKVHGHKFPAYDSALLGYCLAIPAQAMRTQRADALPGR